MENHGQAKENARMPKENYGKNFKPKGKPSVFFLPGFFILFAYCFFQFYFLHVFPIDFSDWAFLLFLVRLMSWNHIFLLVIFLMFLIVCSAGFSYCFLPIVFPIACFLLFCCYCVSYCCQLNDCCFSLKNLSFEIVRKNCPHGTLKQKHTKKLMHKNYVNP